MGAEPETDALLPPLPPALADPTTGDRRPPDVLVAGGGGAALCAGIAARRAGARVLVLDAAPPALLGGNTRHSRNLRIAHEGPSPLFPDRYPARAFAADLIRIGAAGGGDASLARLVAARSADLPTWLAAQGVALQSRAGGLLPWSRRTAFLLGGGTAAVNALAATLHRLGGRLVAGWRVESLAPGGAVRLTEMATGRSWGGRVAAAIAATGGYQADLGWLGETLGPQAAGFVVRGTPYARGELLRDLLDHQGARPAGDGRACHLVAVDARAPAADGGIVTRADGLAWGLVIDRSGQPVRDPAQETGQPRYSRWGRLVADCPGQIAHVILDDAGRRRLGPVTYAPHRADSLAALAGLLAVPEAALAPLVTRPPWFAFSVRPGITFTGLGVAVDDRARILGRDGQPLPGLFAAGMIMAPAVLGGGYLSGCALTISAVFGRLAGEEAARSARTHPLVPGRDPAAAPDPCRKDPQ